MTLGTTLRSATAVAGAGLLDITCWRALSGDLRAAITPGADLTTLVTGLAGLVLCLALTWALLLLALTALEPLSGRDLTRMLGCPAWLRRALLLLTGVAVTGAVAASAGAAAIHPTPYDDLDRAPRVGEVLDGRLDGLPLPERQLGQVERHRPAPTTVVVHPGDSLWSIARDRLGDGDAWPALYARNRATVGADPDLLLPGQRLQVPTHEEER